MRYDGQFLFLLLFIVRPSPESTDNCLVSIFRPFPETTDNYLGSVFFQTKLTPAPYWSETRKPTQLWIEARPLTAMSLWVHSLIYRKINVLIQLKIIISLFSSTAIFWMCCGKAPIPFMVVNPVFTIPRVCYTLNCFASQTVDLSCFILFIIPAFKQ